MSIFDSPTDTAPVGDNGGVVDSQPVVDTGTPVDTGSVDTGTPVADGVVDGAAPDGPKYLDVDEYGDYLVKVKIDGEERELPFNEVRNGVMMQQAFTQRTQQLAAERRQLQQAEALVNALEQNPQKVLAELAQAYDFELDGLQPIERSPAEIQLREIQAQQQALQMQYQEQRLANEIANLERQHGDFDKRAVASIAIQKDIDFTSAFEIHQAQTLMAEQRQKAESDRRAAAAAAAAGATHTQAGGGQGGVYQTSGNSTPAQSIGEAYRMAQAELRR